MPKEGPPAGNRQDEAEVFCFHMDFPAVKPVFPDFLTDGAVKELDAPQHEKDEKGEKYGTCGGNVSLKEIAGKKGSH